MRKSKDSFSTLGGLNGYVSGIFISSWYLPPGRKGLTDNVIKPFLNIHICDFTCIFLRLLQLLQCAARRETGSWKQAGQQQKSESGDESMPTDALANNFREENLICKSAPSLCLDVVYSGQFQFRLSWVEVSWKLS